MRIIEITSLFLIFLSTLEIILIVLFNDPFHTGNTIVIVGQLIVIYGSVVYGAYYWMKREPVLIKKSPAFSTGLISVIGALISLSFFSITDIAQPIGFPEFVIIPDISGLTITYFYLLIAIYWFEFLIGLVIIILEYDSGPSDHLMKTIHQKFTHSKP